MKESTLGKSLRNVNDVASVLVVWETKEGMKESILGKSLMSESMQKSTKIADSWQGSKNQNRSSFADW